MKIEHNIPIPENENGKWQRIFIKMKKGDSVLLSSYKESNNLYSSGVYWKIKIVRRREGKKVRCWRVS